MARETFFRNPYQRFNRQNLDFYIEDGKIPEHIIRKADLLLASLMGKLDAYVKEKYLDRVSDVDGSIYTGVGGIALLYYRMAHLDPAYRDMAANLCNIALRNVSTNRVSFLTGLSGPLALAAAIEQRNSPVKTDLMTRLLSLRNAARDKSIPNEILYGRAGYLYSLLFANKFAMKGTMDRKAIREIVDDMLEDGVNLSKKNPDFPTALLYKWRDKFYLGAAHGIAGILYVLMSPECGLTKQQLDLLVRPTIDWLNTLKYQSNNFMSSINSSGDRLVQWCHGSPGAIYLFIRAAEVFDDPSYLEVAKQQGELVWERGLSRKGYSLCHGVAGNAYSFIALYQATKDLRYLYYTACFVDWCTRYPEHEEMKPDRPYSLYEGIAGLIFLLQDIREVDKARFPGFEI